MLEEVENWVKLYNEAVWKYDIYVEENEARLNYIAKLEEESAIEERRMHRRMKEMQVQMRE